ncbi:lef-7 [Psilogramma increta granulovirus]|uniref:Lef-7 n=1 Tax=Psilogramma increta granulovirus TaxID=2953508 RepID=A0A977TNT5_9BBAC|nr:lef-7 [Psilogramma increta granulovirus]
MNNVNNIDNKMFWSIRKKPVVFKSVLNGNKLKLYNIQDYMVCKSKLKNNNNFKLPTLPQEVIEYIIYQTNNVALYTNLYGHCVKRLVMLLNNHMLKQFFAEAGSNADLLLKKHYNNSPFVPYLRSMFMCKNDEDVSDFVMYEVPDEVLCNIINECDNNLNAMMKFNFAWWRIMRIIMKLLPKDESIQCFNMYTCENSLEDVQIIDKMFSECQTINHKYPVLNYNNYKNMVHKKIDLNMDSRNFIFYKYKQKIDKKKKTYCTPLDYIVNENDIKPLYVTRGFVIVINELHYELDDDGDYLLVFNEDELDNIEQLKFNKEKNEDTYFDSEYDSEDEDDDKIVFEDNYEDYVNNHVNVLKKYK